MLSSSLKLRELIKSVRACKTAADERSVISKECAAIRTSLKEGSDSLRARNVAKLMYIHMLGYPTQFGQMECIKLITSDKYAEKKVGYLGLMILLDEKQEVLTLIENHMMKDLQSSATQFTQGLALCAIANISSADMGRSLASEIHNLLGCQFPYVRKKAALCALRIVRKVGTTDILDMYLGYYSSTGLSDLFSERNHGVLVTSLALVTEALQLEAAKDYLPQYQALVPAAVRMLKNLVMSSYALEHDINGVADPFLQVKILTFLRVVGAGDRKCCDQMNDVLAQVATNTESSKNCGNAILYECVITILAIDADPGLRVLAVNILGRFLVNRDNNIRYVALNTLTKVVSKDVQAVQRHKNTIVDCLKDVDVSIRRRALDLIYTLVNSANIRLLVPDLINYLSLANNDFKEDLTTKICFVVEKYAPSKQWHIDTLIKVLTLAGSYVPEAVGNKLLALISQTESALQSYCVKVLWNVMTNNAPLSIAGTATMEGSEEDAAAYCKKETLLVVSLWCIGEFCDLLCSDVEEDDLNASVGGSAEWKQHKPIPDQVVSVLNALISSHHVTNHSIKQHAMTTLFKVAGKYPEVREPVKEVLTKFAKSRDIEIQQRACEFQVLLAYIDQCPELTERMPPIDLSQMASNISLSAMPTASPTTTTTTAATPAAAASPTAADGLDAMFGGPSAGAKPAAPKAAQGLDFLDDIFGSSSPSSTPAPAAPVAAPASSINNTIDDLFGSGPASTPAAPSPVGNGAPVPAAPPAATITVFNKEGEISVIFNCVKDAGNTSTITASIKNTSSGPLQNISFLAAVPKYAKLTMMPLSDTTAAPGAAIRVSMVIDNPSDPHKAVAMRLKIKYTNSMGQNMEEDAKATNLPAWI